MKIFLTGFQRSGTTLLRHVVRNHPDVRKMFHENCLIGHGIEYIKSVCNFDIDKENWGEKLPWYDIKPRKIYNGTILDYCLDWNELFPDSKIIQIIRHPIDVMNSNLNKFNLGNKQVFEIMDRCIPQIIPKIDLLNNCLSIKFEDLVIAPTEVLTKMYGFLGLDNNPETVMSVVRHKQYRLEGIIKSRVFAYAKENRPYELKIKNFDFGNIIDVLNKIEGTRY